LKESGRDIKEVRPPRNGKFEFDLNYDKDYIITFARKGYISKSVEINTHVPEAVKKDEMLFPFAAYPFQVELNPQADNKVVVFNQPVGMIKYDPSINDFDYDTDYSKSVQAKLDNKKKNSAELAQAEAEAKRKEELEAEKKAAVQRAERIAKEKARTEQAKKAEEEQKRQQEKERAQKIAREKAHADSIR
jgi:regulator of protease activity HflC (stomatin/prohibitin superfamily)